MRLFYLHSSTRYLILMVVIVLKDIRPFMYILIMSLFVIAISLKKLDYSGEKFYDNVQEEFGG